MIRALYKIIILCIQIRYYVIYRLYMNEAHHKFWSWETLGQIPVGVLGYTVVNPPPFLARNILGLCPCIQSDPDVLRRRFLYQQSHEGC